jgi:hypothetical protein
MFSCFDSIQIVQDLEDPTQFVPYEVRRLKINPEILCYEGHHFSQVFSLGLISLVLYLVVFPLLMVRSIH